MSNKRIPADIKVETNGALYAAWSDTTGRSGIAYIKLKTFDIDASYRDPTVALALHVIEQAEMIEQLNNRLQVLESRLGRLFDALNPENDE